MKSLLITLFVAVPLAALGALTYVVTHPVHVAAPGKTVTRLVCPHPDHDAYGPLGGGTLEARIDEHDARWDECVGEGGVPVPGYRRENRWGMVCLKPAGVIFVHGVAW